MAAPRSFGTFVVEGPAHKAPDNSLQRIDHTTDTRMNRDRHGAQLCEQRLDWLGAAAQPSEIFSRDGCDGDNAAGTGVGDDDLELSATEAIHQGVQARSCKPNIRDIFVDHGHDPKAGVFGVARAGRQDRSFSRIERGAGSDTHRISRLLVEGSALTAFGMDLALKADQGAGRSVALHRLGIHEDGRGVRLAANFTLGALCDVRHIDSQGSFI